MLSRRLNRDRAIVGVVATGAALLLAYLAAVAWPPADTGNRLERLLTVAPWHCDVFDPEDRELVARSVETFHDDGVLEGRTRLEDRQAGTVLLEFSYHGVWEFDDPWLTEAIREYRYLEVDEGVFSADELADIEAEFGEPERSRVHALTEQQLVYGAERSLYQCHRRELATRA